MKTIRSVQHSVSNLITIKHQDTLGWALYCEGIRISEWMPYQEQAESLKFRKERYYIQEHEEFLKKNESDEKKWRAYVKNLSKKGNVKIDRSVTIDKAKMIGLQRRRSNV